MDAISHVWLTAGSIGLHRTDIHLRSTPFGCRSVFQFLWEYQHEGFDAMSAAKKHEFQDVRQRVQISSTWPGYTRRDERRRYQQNPDP